MLKWIRFAKIKNKTRNSVASGIEGFCYLIAFYVLNFGLLGKNDVSNMAKIPLIISSTGISQVAAVVIMDEFNSSTLYSSVISTNYLQLLEKCGIAS